MPNRNRRFNLILLASGTVAACTPTATEATRDREVATDPDVLTLAVGERETVPGTARVVTFVRVPSDSRCPRDTTCVSEGSFTVSLGISDHAAAPRSGDPELALELSGHQPRVVDGLRFAAAQLSPEPELGRPPAPAAYILTLRVTSEP